MEVVFFEILELDLFIVMFRLVFFRVGELFILLLVILMMWFIF